MNLPHVKLDAAFPSHALRTPENGTPCSTLNNFAAMPTDVRSLRCTSYIAFDSCFDRAFRTNVSVGILFRHTCTGCSSFRISAVWLCLCGITTSTLSTLCGRIGSKLKKVLPRSANGNQIPVRSEILLNTGCIAKSEFSRTPRS